VTENPRLEILDPEPGADGEPKIIASASSDRSSFDLPPGDYVLRATADIVSGETAFSLDAGEAIEVSVALGAGVLTVSARGGKRLDVLSREKDIYGKQAILATRHAESATLTLPAGALEVMVTRSDGSEQRLPATVVAGERTDLTFE
jgi:Ca-activated chloride channel family protein